MDPLALESYGRICLAFAAFCPTNSVDLLTVGRRAAHLLMFSQHCPESKSNIHSICPLFKHNQSNELMKINVERTNLF